MRINWSKLPRVMYRDTYPSDYRPDLDETDELEDLFGALLATGHTVREAADFVILVGNEGVD